MAAFAPEGRHNGLISSTWPLQSPTRVDSALHFPVLSSLHTRVVFEGPEARGMSPVQQQQVPAGCMSLSCTGCGPGQPASWWGLPADQHHTSQVWGKGPLPHACHHSPRVKSCTLTQAFYVPHLSDLRQHLMKGSWLWKCLPPI